MLHILVIPAKSVSHSLPASAGGGEGVISFHIHLFPYGNSCLSFSSGSDDEKPRPMGSQIKLVGNRFSLAPAGPPRSCGQQGPEEEGGQEALFSRPLPPPHIPPWLRRGHLPATGSRPDFHRSLLTGNIKRIWGLDKSPMSIPFFSSVPRGGTVRGFMATAGLLP